MCVCESHGRAALAAGLAFTGLGDLLKLPSSERQVNEMSNKEKERKRKRKKWKIEFTEKAIDNRLVARFWRCGARATSAKKG